MKFPLKIITTFLVASLPLFQAQDMSMYVNIDIHFINNCSTSPSYVSSFAINDCVFFGRDFLEGFGRMTCNESTLTFQQFNDSNCTIPSNNSTFFTMNQCGPAPVNDEIFSGTTTFWVPTQCNVPYPPMLLTEPPSNFPANQINLPVISAQIFTNTTDCLGQPAIVLIAQNNVCLQNGEESQKFTCDNDTFAVTLEGFEDNECMDSNQRLTSASGVCLVVNNENIFLNCQGIEENSDNALIIVLPVVIGSFCVCLLIGLVVAFVVLRRRKHSQVASDIENKGFPLLHDVEIGKEIGSGEWGLIYKGFWSGVDVAIKQIKTEQVEALTKELLILHTVRHPHTLQFFGIYISGLNQVSIILEFMNKGDLRSLLLSDFELTPKLLIQFCLHTSLGMEYLHEQQIIHRDLAARNILINKQDTKYSAKISDFGLSRQIESYYEAGPKNIPIRWTAPESLQTLKFDFASDIWSYGVVLWEIFSRGNVPYSGYSNHDLVEKLTEDTHFKLPVPVEMKLFPELSKLMDSCFHRTPSKRPTFQEINKKNKNSSENQTQEDFIFFRTPSTTYNALHTSEKSSARDSPVSSEDNKEFNQSYSIMESKSNPLSHAYGNPKSDSPEFSKEDKEMVIHTYGNLKSGINPPEFSKENFDTLIKKVSDMEKQMKALKEENFNLKKQLGKKK